MRPLVVLALAVFPALAGSGALAQSRYGPASPIPAPPPVASSATWNGPMLSWHGKTSAPAATAPTPPQAESQPVRDPAFAAPPAPSPTAVYAALPPAPRAPAPATAPRPTPVQAPAPISPPPAAVAAAPAPMPAAAPVAAQRPYPGYGVPQLSHYPGYGPATPSAAPAQPAAAAPAPATQRVALAQQNLAGGPRDGEGVRIYSVGREYGLQPDPIPPPTQDAVQGQDISLKDTPSNSSLTQQDDTDYRGALRDQPGQNAQF